MSWGQPETLAERLLQSGLQPAALAYASAGFLRLSAYSSGLLKAERLNIPVVSIGNITVGGTGKTPITIDITSRLLEAGFHPAVLSRGYKRQSKAPYLVLSENTSCADAGDEPFMIRNNVPQATVIVGSKRVVTGRLAQNELGCDVVVLDDGFQHVKLRRQYDVVLLDYNEDPLRDSVLPAGRLREPLVALGRATSIVITRAPDGLDSSRITGLKSMIRRYNQEADITVCKFQPYCPTDLKGARVLAFAGIARPSAFKASLERLGAVVVKLERFADHHWYNEADLDVLQKLVKEHRADYLITTEKDSIKIPPIGKDIAILTARQKTVWLGEPPQAVADLMRHQRLTATADKALC